LLNTVYRFLKALLVDTPEEAAQAADRIGGDTWVVKAQVHAGGRGKAGGVKLVKTKEEIKAFAQQWLGTNLVTYQTDEGGQPVSKILVEPCTDIDQELYLGAVVDRSSRRVVLDRKSTRLNSSHANISYAVFCLKKKKKKK